MDIYWGGQACFKIKGRSTSLLIDPFDPAQTGLKLPKDFQSDIVLITHDHPDHNFTSGVSGDPVVISGPGEYEIKGVAIEGVSVFHDKSKGGERGKNTAYHINFEGLSIVHLGDLGHVLEQEQLEEIGLCDILMIPVGGVYTIDAKDAIEVVSQLEPKIVLPMHYKLPGLKYELEDVDPFLREMGVTQTMPKLSITKEKLPQELQVIVLK